MDGRPTVVLAEDNARIAETICDLLRPFYNVIKVARDGEEAIQSILELKPELLVIDTSLSKVNGYTVAKCVQKAGMETRVIFLTLMLDEDYVREARLIGHGFVVTRRLALDLLRAIAAAQDNHFFCSI
jgi:DNA-binding NarL/FixJ family response regulator